MLPFSTYPQELLPQLIFKQITADLTGYFICRKVRNKSLLNEPLPEILPDEVLGIETPSDCFDFSTNLPGVFKLNHNFLEITGDDKKYFRTYWDYQSEVKTPVFEQDFFIDENIGWFFIQIDKINGLTIPFNRNAEKAVSETATAIVVHTPTNSNFWHFSVKWKDANGYISTGTSKWKNNVIATVRAMLSELIRLTYISLEVPEGFYKKN